MFLYQLVFPLFQITKLKSAANQDSNGTETCSLQVIKDKKGKQNTKTTACRSQLPSSLCLPFLEEKKGKKEKANYILKLPINLQFMHAPKQPPSHRVSTRSQGSC